MIRLFLILAFLPVASLAASMVPNGRVIWEEPLERFGGLSGIEVADDGNFLAISDRGVFVTGNLQHTGEALTGVRLGELSPILDSHGVALTGRNTDAEGLAISVDGKIYVSFEANHRVMVHESIMQGSEFLPKHPDFSNLQNNSGLEALAIDSAGRIVAIPERSGNILRPFPVYRFVNNNWEIAYHLPRRGSFLVTGADFGPDGWLYLLERDFTWLGGFSTRVRRFMLDETHIVAEETLLETSPGQLDNMEGISVWTGPDDQIRISLLSDDNFNPLQRTIVAEYLLKN